VKVATAPGPWRSPATGCSSLANECSSHESSASRGLDRLADPPHGTIEINGQPLLARMDQFLM
jgi:hypothetical protein